MYGPLVVQRLDGVDESQNPGDGLCGAQRSLRELPFQRAPGNVFGDRERGARGDLDSARHIPWLVTRKHFEQPGQMSVLNAAGRVQARHAGRVQRGHHDSPPRSRLDGEPTWSAALRTELALEREARTERGFG